MAKRSLNGTRARNTERREILLGDLYVTSLMEQLPPTAFPVSARITMRRETADDELYFGYKPPEYPVPVRRPVGAYIPESTVFFENPAEIASEPRKTWKFHEFVESLRKQLSEIEELPVDAEKRIYLQHLTIVEIPPAYVSSEDGHRIADPTLHQNEAKMRIGHFNKYSDISISGLREELGDALPDDTTKPLHLTRVDEVTAKPFDGGAAQSKRRYYTKGQAEQVGDLEKTPAIWMFTDRLEHEQDARPLQTVLPEIGEFFPVLSEQDFFQPVKFYGKTRESQTFVADEMTKL